MFDSVAVLRRQCHGERRIHCAAQPRATCGHSRVVVESRSLLSRCGLFDRGLLVDFRLAPGFVLLHFAGKVRAVGRGRSVVGAAAGEETEKRSKEHG